MNWKCRELLTNSGLDRGKGLDAAHTSTRTACPSPWEFVWSQRRESDWKQIASGYTLEVNIDSHLTPLSPTWVPK